MARLSLGAPSRAGLPHGGTEAYLLAMAGTLPNDPPARRAQGIGVLSRFSQHYKQGTRAPKTCFYLELLLDMCAYVLHNSM